MKGMKQIQSPAIPTSTTTEKNLVEVPRGRLTEAGFVRNIDIALRYIESWLRGYGCVPIYNLMEDAAAAEISRPQLWQWIRYGVRLDDGRAINGQMMVDALGDILDRMKQELGNERFASFKFKRAAELLTDSFAGEFQEFLTSAVYAEFA